MGCFCLEEDTPTHNRVSFQLQPNIQGLRQKFERNLSHEEAAVSIQSSMLKNISLPIKTSKTNGVYFFCKQTSGGTRQGRKLLKPRATTLKVPRMPFYTCTLFAFCLIICDSLCVYKALCKKNNIVLLKHTKPKGSSPFVYYLRNFHLRHKNHQNFEEVLSQVEEDVSVPHFIDVSPRQISGFSLLQPAGKRSHHPHCFMLFSRKREKHQFPHIVFHHFIIFYCPSRATRALASDTITHNFVHYKNYLS